LWRRNWYWYTWGMTRTLVGVSCTPWPIGWTLPLAVGSVQPSFAAKFGSGRPRLGIAREAATGDSTFFQLVQSKGTRDFSRGKSRIFRFEATERMCRSSPAAACIIAGIRARPISSRGASTDRCRSAEWPMSGQPGAQNSSKATGCWMHARQVPYGSPNRRSPKPLLGCCIEVAPRVYSNWAPGS
jgi:hypothetical protein